MQLLSTMTIIVILYDNRFIRILYYNVLNCNSKKYTQRRYACGFIVRRVQSVGPPVACRLSAAGMPPRYLPMPTARTQEMKRGENYNYNN